MLRYGNGGDYLPMEGAVTTIDYFIFWRRFHANRHIVAIGVWLGQAMMRNAAPVPSNAANRPNTVKMASAMGMRHINQKGFD